MSASVADILREAGYVPVAPELSRKVEMPGSQSGSLVPAVPGIKYKREAKTAELLQATTEACRGLTGYITPSDLLAKLCPEDIQELEVSPDPLPFLRSFAIASVWMDFRMDGIAPPTWDQLAHCNLCGPVLLWASIRVAGCPWCWNRLHHIKIPRP